MLGNGGEQLFNCFKALQENLWPAHADPEANEKAALLQT